MSEFIGTKVSIPGTRGNGILRYYGPIEGKNGIFGGIELMGPIAASRGKNSGAVDGIQYFEVERPMTGLFLPIDRLKTANPQLSRLSNSRVSSGSSLRFNRADITPSPVQRRQISRPSSSKGSPFSSPYPVKSSQVLNIPKRSKAYDPTYSSGNINGVDISQLEVQLNEYKLKYENSVKEMEEKSIILNDLRTTVSQIQPILEEYEVELADKDKRLAKQKSDFEKAREEWRESLNLMATSQQENEAYFESQLEELTAKLTAVNNKTNSGDVSSEEYTHLTKNFEALSQDMETLKKEHHATLIEKDNEIKRLKERQNERCEKGSASPTSEIISENEFLKEKIKSLEKELEVSRKEAANLKAELDLVKKEKDEQDLVSSVQSVSISSSNDLNEKILKLQNELDGKKDLDKQISDLKHELEMRPTFDELTELQESISEIENIHNQEIQSRQEKLLQLQINNSNLEQKIDDLLKINDQLESSLNKLALDNASIDEADKPVTPPTNNEESLPIYQPHNAIDPGDGKEDWCGLCERDGHNSINCPYENDMF